MLRGELRSLPAAPEGVRGADANCPAPVEEVEALWQNSRSFPEGLVGDAAVKVLVLKLFSSFFFWFSI